MASVEMQAYKISEVNFINKVQGKERTVMAYYTYYRD